MKHEKTFEAIGKLKEVEVELHRLKNTLDMANRGLDAKREWAGLTADELNMIGDSMRTWNSHSLADVYVAIEAKLKEKNT